MRYLTAGESHGEALYGIIEGLPSGLKIDCAYISELLSIRQSVCGRGSRSKSIKDEAQIKSGVTNGVTTGAPIAVVIPNGNCGGKGEFDFYRPGHVDFAADVKYGYGDPALGAERASARETAMRTALGAIALTLLKELGVSVKAFVTQIGEAKADVPLSVDELVSCNTKAASGIKAQIDEAAKSGDTLGGKIKLVISGLRAGIGSHAHYDRRLDYLLCGALTSIPAVKAVELGLGTDFACSRGSHVADGFVCDNGRICRTSNNGGGIEGGISNGQNVELLITVKPIPSIAALKTVNNQGKECLTGKVRGDVTAVPAACTVAQSVAALELTAAILETFGGDTMDELIERYSNKGNFTCKR